MISSIISLFGQLFAYLLGNRHDPKIHVDQLVKLYHPLSKGMHIKSFNPNRLIEIHENYNRRDSNDLHKVQFFKLQFTLTVSNDKNSNLGIRNIQYRILNGYNQEVVMDNQYRLHLIDKNSIITRKVSDNNYQLETFKKLNHMNISANQTESIEVILFIHQEDKRYFDLMENGKDIFLELSFEYSNVFGNAAIKRCKVKI